MLPWQVWLIVSGICFIIEIATVGFLIFWLAIAALITCLFSLFVSNIISQTVIFIILSSILILATRPFANKISKKDQTITNSNSLIGKDGIVVKQINETAGSVGQVKVGSDVWTAIVTNSNVPIPVGSTVRVLGIEGVKLIVEPTDIKSQILN